MTNLRHFRGLIVIPFSRAVRRLLQGCTVLLLLGGTCMAAHYYVDSRGGADRNPGTQRAPWRSLNKVNSYPFVPGDVVSFMRGSTWTGCLVISRSGAAGRPILVNAFGSGEKPLFKNPGGGHVADAIKIAGDYIILDGVQTDTVSWGGIHIMLGADHNIVRNCEVKHAGISIAVHGQFNLVTKNYVHHPHMVVDTPGGDDDYGADGITCWNSYNEVSWNRIDSCFGHSYDYGEDGGGLGIFAGEYNENVDSCYFHHNICIDSDGMTEIGSDGNNRHVYGFVEAYNVYINTRSGAPFLVLHLDGPFATGVRGMRFENNTVYIAKPSFAHDDALKWGKSTMWDGILSLTGNVIVVSNYSTVMARDHPGSPALSRNVFWSVEGRNNVGRELDATNVFADPQFVDLVGRDVHLRASSPAVNRGTALAKPPSMFVDPGVDADGRIFAGAPDAGAYELQP